MVSVLFHMYGGVGRIGFARASLGGKKLWPKCYVRASKSWSEGYFGFRSLIKALERSEKFIFGAISLGLNFLIHTCPKTNQKSYFWCKYWHFLLFFPARNDNFCAICWGSHKKLMIGDIQPGRNFFESYMPKNQPKILFSAQIWVFSPARNKLKS